SFDIILYVLSFPTRRSSDLRSCGLSRPLGINANGRIGPPLGSSRGLAHPPRHSQWTAHWNSDGGVGLDSLGFRSTHGHGPRIFRSEEHTSELQSRFDLV